MSKLKDYSSRNCAKINYVEEQPLIGMHIQQTPFLLKPAPPWAGIAIVDTQFREIALADYKGKYLVFFFYPADFTFVCPTELIQFSDRIDEFRSIGCEVVAASTDSQYSHLAWITTPRKQGGLGGMRIPMLSDKSLKISRTYGVLDEENGIAFKALFIIDDKQILRQITINDITLSRSVDETLRLVQTCQFTDCYGDTCPAGPKQNVQSVAFETNKHNDFFSPI